MMARKKPKAAKKGLAEGIAPGEVSASVHLEIFIPFSSCCL
jgi:hypothetical protein